MAEWRKVVQSVWRRMGRWASPGRRGWAFPGGWRVFAGLALCSVTMVWALFTCSGCRRPEHAGPAIGWTGTVAPFETEPEIRVAVARAEAELRVAAEGSCEVVVGPSGDTVAAPPSLDYRIELALDGFLLNGGHYSAPWLEFRPGGGSRLYLNGAPFPGRMRIYSEGGGLTAVNVVPLERYLEGVVGQEMYPSWEPEALKAQAVAARSFALSRMAGRGRHLYDVLSTVISQRYDGGEAPASVIEAVRATRGVALVHKGAVSPAYYHSTCGGHTANASEAFGGPGEEFLRGVRCPYCEDAGPFAWTLDMGAEEIARALGSSGKVTALQAMGRRSDGRPEKIRVFYEDAFEDVPTGRFRERLGRSRMRSERFWIETAPGGFRFLGRGFGHGVGLCQYGAQRMAERGASFAQTLAHYYPELELARLY